MSFANALSIPAIAPLLESLLPDFILGFTFFTALAYAVLGKRFDHQRPAIAMSAAVGLALAIGLVSWEYQRGWSVRNLGPIAIGFAVILLAMIMFQGIRQTGGSWAGAGIAFGASILVAWVLGFDWPIPSEIVQTLAIVGLIVGIVAFLFHMHGRGPPSHFIPTSVQPELADMRHDMRDLYEDRHVGEKIRGALFGLRKETDVFVEHPQEGANILHQLRRVLPAEGWLAEKRGSFPNWAGSTWDAKHHVPMRNAAVTTIAPTGSISIIARCSSGIEPIYSLAYRRRALEGQEFVQVHPLLEKIGRSGGWITDSVHQALVDGNSAVQIPALPSGLADALVTAHEVTAEWHVRMQAAFQQNVDNAVSKTVNLPHCASTAEVDKVFRMAFELGCKGVTVYRDGARRGQTFSTGTDKDTVVQNNGSTPRTRCRVTSGQTFKFRMGCGTLFVTVNQDENGLCEVFANLGKAGGCPSQSEATCRAISTALRSGVSSRELIEQLRGIRCLSTAAARKGDSTIKVLSCPDAIARAIEESTGGSPNRSAPGKHAAGRACPFCSHRMRSEAGCFLCDDCLYSSCG